jgi:hypothetical protein
MHPLYAKAVEWRVPVILDLRVIAEQKHPVCISELVQVAGDFGDVNFVIAQSQWHGAEMLRVIDNLPNLYFCFDTAALLTIDTRGFVNFASGQSRCMWGSNGLPWKEALDEVARIETLNKPGLPRDNAVQLFGLDHLQMREATPFIESEPTPARIVAE